MMTRDEIIGLLQKAAGSDSRKIDNFMVTAWHEASEDAGWTVQSSHAALRMHTANSTEYLKPAHITKNIREWKRQPPPVSELRALDGPPASDPEFRARWMAEFKAMFKDVPKMDKGEVVDEGA